MKIAKCVILTLVLFLTFIGSASAQNIPLEPEVRHYTLTQAELGTGSPFMNPAFEERMIFLFEVRIPQEFGVPLNELEFRFQGQTNGETWNVVSSDPRFGILDSFNRSAIVNSTDRQKNDLLENFLELSRAMTAKSWAIKKRYVTPDADIGIYGAVDEPTGKTVRITVTHQPYVPVAELIPPSPTPVDLDPLREKDRQQDDEITALNDRLTALENNQHESDWADILLGTNGSRNGFSGILLGGHVGLRFSDVAFFDHIDATAAYMVQPVTSGSITLPEVGKTSMRHQSFRTSMALFPLRNLGFVAGFQRDEEVFLDVGQNGSSKKAALLGVRFAMPLADWFNLSAEGLWAPGVYSRFDNPEDTTELSKFQFGLRATFSL